MEDKWTEEQEKNKYSKIQWFFVVIFIPSLFAIAVALIVATVAGVNVYETAKDFSGKIPFLSSSEQDSQQKGKEIESKLKALKDEVRANDATIADLKTKIDSKDQEILKLQREKDQLQRQIEELTAGQAEKNREFRDIVKT
jgi:peptidoglycan hydrolase CwlO-like protein